MMDDDTALEAIASSSGKKPCGEEAFCLYPDLFDLTCYCISALKRSACFLPRDEAMASERFLSPNPSRMGGNAFEAR